MAPNLTPRISLVIYGWPELNSTSLTRDAHVWPEIVITSRTRQSTARGYLHFYLTISKPKNNPIYAVFGLIFIGRP